MAGELLSLAYLRCKKDGASQRCAGTTDPAVARSMYARYVGS